MCINNFPGNLTSKVKLFADNTSISIVYNINVSTDDNSNDMERISESDFQLRNY